MGQQIKVEDESNPDVETRLGVMERFREFFSDQNRGGIMCLNGEDGKFYSKLTCTCS